MLEHGRGDDTHKHFGTADSTVRVKAFAQDHSNIHILLLTDNMTDYSCPRKLPRRDEVLDPSPDHQITTVNEFVIMVPVARG